MVKRMVRLQGDAAVQLIQQAASIRRILLMFVLKLLLGVGSKKGRLFCHFLGKKSSFAANTLYDSSIVFS